MGFAQSNAAKWNTVFKEAVAAGSGWNTDDIMDMFVICENNPVQAGDPAVCGEEGLSPQIGDLRYSMYFFVPSSKLLSFRVRPSADDPLTGELIQGNAFYYNGRWIARRTMDIFKRKKVINGRRNRRSGFSSKCGFYGAQ